MEIHKPKPVRNWREFLGEVGIIVLGVLIALAAEQFVEWLHWRGLVQEARVSIRNEISEDAAFARGWQLRGVCFDGQLDALEAALAAKPNGAPTPQLKTRFITTFLPWIDGAWSSAQAAQALVHMPEAERERYATIYGEMNQIPAAQTYTFNGQATLWTLVGSPRPLTAELRQQILQAINQERAYIFYQTTYARDVVKLTQDAGIPLDPERMELVRSRARSCPKTLM